MSGTSQNRFSLPSSPPNSSLNPPNVHGSHSRSPSPTTVNAAAYQRSSAAQYARNNPARQTFGASKSPASPRVQRPASEMAHGGGSGWTQAQSQLLNSAQLPPGSAGLGMTSPDALDQWFENLGSYEETLEEMAAASLDQNFKEELVAIEQWFRVLSEAERTAALYSLLQHSSQMQIRFFITVLQQMSRSDPVSQALFSPSVGANLDGQLEADMSRMSFKSPNLAAVSGISAKNSPNMTAAAINRQSLAAGEHHLSPDDALNAHRQRFNSKRTSAPGHLPGPGTIGAGSSTDNLRSPSWQRGSGLEQVQERRSPTPSAASDVRPKSSDSGSFVRSDSVQDFADDQAIAIAQANANMSSPLQQSANWSSMVNTPSISNFPMGGSGNGNQNQFDADLQNWYASVTNNSSNSNNSNTNNSAIRLDDARKFRRQSRQSVNYDDINAAQNQDDYTNGALNNGLLTPGGTSVNNNQNLQQLLAQQQQLINNLSSPGQTSAPTSPNPSNPLLTMQLQSLHQQQQLLQQQQLALGRLQQQQQSVRAGPGLGIFGGNNASRMPSPYKQSFNQQSLGIPPNQTATNKRSISTQSRQRNNTISSEEEVDERVLNDVATWLRVLRLHKYTPNFQESNWKEMVNMCGADLEAKGVAAVGARRKMLKEFEKVRDRFDIPATPDQETEMREEKEKEAAGAGGNQ